MVPYEGLGVGLHCWHTGCVVVAIDGEWKSTLLSPCVMPIPVAMITWFVSPLGDNTDG